MRKSAKKFVNKILPIIFTIGTITTLTVVSMLYAKGYRVYFAKNESETAPIPSISVKKTGLLSVRSIPEGAKIYLNDKLYDTTNSTISSLEIGTYSLLVKRDGFEDYKKQVQVVEDQVVDITALLVLKGGNLNQITWNGVGTFEISNNGLLVAYTSDQEEFPGIWLISLSNSPLNIFSVDKKLLVKNTESLKFSKMEKITFSNDDSQLLVEDSAGVAYLIDLNKNISQNFTLVKNKPALFADWKAIDLKKKTERANTLNLTPEIRNLAISENSVWSYDGEKFFIVENTDKDNYRVKVYNFEKPLPVGEKPFYDTIAFQGDETSVYWYSDSKHLLLVSKKNIDLISIDGESKFNVFSSGIVESKAYPNPFGDKIIILYKFKEENPANLYTVSIR